MTKLGKSLIQAAKEGIAIARGELDPATYRVHTPDEDGDLVVVRRRLMLGSLATVRSRPGKVPMMGVRKSKPAEGRLRGVKAKAKKKFAASPKRSGK